MMNIRKLDDQISVCPQLRVDELAAVAALGFRSVICNRPDGEEAGQPAFAQIAARAAAQGLMAAHVPVSPSGPGAADVAAFARQMATLPKPVLAYCRSGMRAATTWQHSQTAK